MTLLRHKYDLVCPNLDVYVIIKTFVAEMGCYIPNYVWPKPPADLGQSHRSEERPEGWSGDLRTSRPPPEPRAWGRPSPAARSAQHHRDPQPYEAIITFIISWAGDYSGWPSRRRKAPHSTQGWWRWVWCSIWCGICVWDLSANRWARPPLRFSHSYPTGTDRSKSEHGLQFTVTFTIQERFVY